MRNRVPLPPSEQPKPATTNLEINQRRRRLSRLLEAASSHINQLDDEYLSLHQLHGEGKAGRRRSGKARKRCLPKVPAYLRENQPKTKYITDPAALTGPGQQDLQSASFLINQLETGRVERLRRFQLKARRKKRRKKKLNKKKKEKCIEQDLVEDTFDNISKEEQELTVYNRLSQAPHAKEGDSFQFINKPQAHCKSHVAQIEAGHLSHASEITSVVNKVLRVLDKHSSNNEREHGGNPCLTVATSGNSIWSSLPIMLENDVILPTLEAYRKAHEHDVIELTPEEHDETLVTAGSSSTALVPPSSPSTSRGKQQQVSKLQALKRLRESSFEEQVESVVHRILAWFFAQYGGVNLGAAIPRSGRASVVKKYEELCKRTPHAITTIASITRHHGVDVEEEEKERKKREKERERVGPSHHDATRVGYVKLNAGQHGKQRGGGIMHKPHKPNKKKSFIQLNKMQESLKSYVPEIKEAALFDQQKKRRQSLFLVQARRRSMVVEKLEDVEAKKIARQQRIFVEMETAIKERRTRMWCSITKMLTFWKTSTSAFLNQKKMNEATLKVQSLFRKTLFKMRGPAMIRLMFRARHALLPKLKRARIRIKRRNADKLVLFLKAVQELGGVRAAIRKFKKQNLLTQRLFRTYTVITQERLNCLTTMFKREENLRHLEKLQEARQLQNFKSGRNMAKKKKKNKKQKSTTISQHFADQDDNDRKKKMIEKHHGRKKIARQFVGMDSSKLRRIEKHVHAIQEAEDMVKEAVAMNRSNPYIPTHIRRHVLFVYLQERRKEHVRHVDQERNHFGGDVNGEGVKGVKGMFSQSHMLDVLRNEDMDSHPLILSMGRPPIKKFAPLHLFTGNRYSHTKERRRADDDMRELVELGIEQANVWVMEQKDIQERRNKGVEQGVEGVEESLRVKDSDVREVMRRSSVVGTSNPQMRADYLKTMLEENMGLFR